MSIVTFAKKHKYVLAVAVLIPLALFYLQEDLGKVSLDFLQGKQQSISSYLSCANSKIFEAQLMQARKKPTDQVRLLVHFNERPSVDVKDFFASQGVILHTDTWVLDYAVAETTVNRLCFLAGLPGITGISLGES